MTQRMLSSCGGEEAHYSCPVRWGWWGCQLTRGREVRTGLPQPRYVVLFCGSPAVQHIWNPETPVEKFWDASGLVWSRRVWPRGTLCYLAWPLDVLCMSSDNLYRGDDVFGLYQLFLVISVLGNHRCVFDYLNNHIFFIYHIYYWSYIYYL